MREGVALSSTEVEVVVEEEERTVEVTRGIDDDAGRSVGIDVALIAILEDTTSAAAPAGAGAGAGAGCIFQGLSEV